MDERTLALFVGGAFWLWSVVAAFRAGQDHERDERERAREGFFRDILDPRSEIRRRVEARNAELLGRERQADED